MESKPFQINKGIVSQYKKKLRTLYRPMMKEVLNAIIDIYRNEKEDISFSEDAMFDMEHNEIKRLKAKYEQIFSDLSFLYSRNMVLQTLRYGNSVFKAVVKDLLPKDTFSMKGSAITKGMQETIKASIQENVSLIKSIESKYFEQIETAVYRSIQNGTGLTALKKEIQKYNGMTERRANLIAEDQTKKAYTSINLRNFQKYGIKKFKWVHSGGTVHPREYHLEKAPKGLNGGIFEIDNPPIIDKRTGERGYPAQLPYCHCVMTAVVDFDES